MNEWSLMAFTFLGIVAGALLVLTALRRLLAPAPMPAWQLHDVSDESILREKPLLHPLTGSMAAGLPMSRAEKTELGAELKNAGYYKPSALIEYAAIRTLLVLIPLVATGILAYLAPAERLWSILAGGAIAVILGFSLPRIYVLLRTRWRRREIERALPLTIDLLTLCLSAGQNVLGALKQVSSELRLSHPVLAEELGIVRQQAEMHSLGVALRQWAERTPVPEVRNLALILEQSERLGTDVSSTLQEFSTHYRTTLRQRAEARGNRVSFWMLLPSVFCLWTASAIILIGPAYVEFLHHTRDQTPGLFLKAHEDINRVNQRPQQNQTAPR